MCIWYPHKRARTHTHRNTQTYTHVSHKRSSWAEIIFLTWIFFLCFSDVKICGTLKCRQCTSNKEKTSNENNEKDWGKTEQSLRKLQWQTKIFVACTDRWKDKTDATKWTKCPWGSRDVQFCFNGAVGKTWQLLNVTLAFFLGRLVPNTWHEMRERKCALVICLCTFLDAKKKGPRHFCQQRKLTVKETI